MRFSVHLDYILGSLPLADRFSAAAQLGFNSIEWPFPYSCAAHEHAALLQDNGLTQISLGAPACNYRAGEPGFSITPGLEDRFDRSIDTAIERATIIGCGNVHVFAGPKSADVSDELALDLYCHNLQTAHDRLAQHGLRMVIEAINAWDFFGYFMNRLDKVEAAIRLMQRPQTGVILDVYHAAKNGEDPTELLRRNPSCVAHVQLADYPGRHEPGTGEFDFDAFLKVLAEVDYHGSIGLEYIPTRPILDGVPLWESLSRLRDPRA